MNTQEAITVSHSAGGVVLNSTGQVLIVNQNNDSWSLPKGHVEPDEEILDAAQREIMEESGITQLVLIDRYVPYSRFKIGKDGIDDPTELKTIHMFLFRTTEMELQPQDPLNPEARWVDPEQVVSMLIHTKDQEFFNSILPQIQTLL